jgi:hypothetical protein
MTTVHDADFTPLQALQSATWRNAGCPRDAGDPADIARGTVAGIMLFDRNPLGHISATRAIHTVVHRADYLDRGAWDAMLAPVRARVAARETEAH